MGFGADGPAGHFGSLDQPGPVAGGAWPGFGVGTADVAATSGDGVSGLAARGDHFHKGVHSVNGLFGDVTVGGGVLTVANAAALAALASGSYLDGQPVYVQSYKATFQLVTSTQAASANVRIAASGAAGKLWVRVMESTAWWSQLSWFVDPANSSGTASDENTGASLALPLATFAEQNRRFAQRRLPGTETNSFSITLMSDAADTDYPQVHIDSNYRNAIVNVTVLGTVTATAIGVITAAQARNAATAPNGVPNTVTVPGFNFATHVGQYVRLVGTPTTVAIIEADLGANTAQLGTQVAGFVEGAAGGFTVGQTIELAVLPKIGGALFRGPGMQPLLIDLKINPTGQSNITAEGIATNLVLQRCELRSTAGGFVRCTNVNVVACSAVGQTWEFRGGFNSTGLSFINCPVIVFGQGAGGVDSVGTVRGLGFVNSYCVVRPFNQIIFASDVHTFNAGAGKAVIGLDPGAVVRFNASYYGSGNNATSAGVALPFDAIVSYSAGTPPINDCGAAVYKDGAGGTVPLVTTGGSSTAYAALPLAMTSKLNAMVGV